MKNKREQTKTESPMILLRIGHRVYEESFPERNILETRSILNLTITTFQGEYVGRKKKPYYRYYVDGGDRSRFQREATRVATGLKHRKRPWALRPPFIPRA